MAVNRCLNVRVGPTAWAYVRRAAFSRPRAQPCPTACLNRCFDHSPTDALINFVARCGLPRQILVRLELGTLTPVRITGIPQRRPACRGYAGWLSLHPDVMQLVPDIGTVGDEGDDARLPVADRAKLKTCTCCNAFVGVAYSA